MDVRKIDVKELLPQVSPFVMVDKIERFTESEIESSFLVKEENIFIEGDYLSIGGIVENMAQTCALRLGYLSKYINKREIDLGFIGAVNNCKIEKYPVIGDVLKTCVTVKEEIFNITLINSEIYVNNELLVSTEMKIAIPNSFN